MFWSLLTSIPRRKKWYVRKVSSNIFFNASVSVLSGLINR